MSRPMSRPAVIAAAAILLTLSAVFAQAIMLPGRVMACSCAGAPPPLAEIAAADNVAIVAGTVGPALADRTPVAVDAWFHGDQPTELVWLSGGTQMMSSCDIFMKAGERRLFVLYGQPEGIEGIYSANSCSPSGVIGTPEGDALVAEAIQAFGDPQAPPVTEPETAPPAAPANPTPAPSNSLASGDVAMLWVAAGIGLAVALFVGVFLVARLRRAD